MSSFKQWIIKKRREFHKYPELSFNEFKTQDIIMNVLSEIGILNYPIAKTGVIAYVKGKNKGPCIAIRSDMDALPIYEKETKLNYEYISKYPGVMHACGHDGHMAIALGVAKLLNEKKNQLSGTVKFIFQPGEEQAPGGAIQIIKERGLEDVDAIIGLHIFGNIDAGYVHFCSGPFMSSSHDFIIKLKGKSGHISTPHECINPIEIAAEFISNVQKEISKSLDNKKYTFGFGLINGGTKFNIIPDEIKIAGSYRTFNENDTNIIEQKMRKSLETIIQIYNKTNFEKSSYELEIIHGYPVLENDFRFTQNVNTLLNNTQFDLKIENDASPIFGSEDFAYYLEHIPGMFLFLGTRNYKKNIININHSNYFDIDEDILLYGVNILSTIAIDFLEHSQEYLQ